MPVTRTFFTRLWFPVRVYLVVPTLQFPGWLFPHYLYVALRSVHATHGYHVLHYVYVQVIRFVSLVAFPRWTPHVPVPGCIGWFYTHIYSPRLVYLLPHTHTQIGQPNDPGRDDCTPQASISWLHCARTRALNDERHGKSCASNKTVSTPARGNEYHTHLFSPPRGIFSAGGITAEHGASNENKQRIMPSFWQA